jgi:hypothetical protein
LVRRNAPANAATAGREAVDSEAALADELVRMLVGSGEDEACPGLLRLASEMPVDSRCDITFRQHQWIDRHMTQVVLRQHIFLKRSDIGGLHLAENQALSLQHCRLANFPVQSGEALV